MTTKVLKVIIVVFALYGVYSAAGFFSPKDAVSVETPKAEIDSERQANNQRLLEDCLIEANASYEEKQSTGIPTFAERQLFLEEYKSNKNDCYQVYPVN